MISGWIRSAHLAAQGGGTACMTLGCPDDFHAVRVGFANVLTTPWTVTRLIGCASTTFHNYVHPTGGGRWTDLTFAMGGRDDSRLVTRPDAPRRITVAPTAIDSATGETEDPAWTWSDWTPLPSLPPDPATGLRVLMLRALIPSGQTISFANGQMRALTGDATLNHGFDYFIGGLKHDADQVNDPAEVSRHTTDIWAKNALASGTLMPMVQFLTRRAGVVGMVTGDSHHQGTSTTTQFTNFLYRATVSTGRDLIGDVPLGMVNCAVGGLASASFFSRLDALLPIVRPSYAVLPGWSYNDVSGTVHAGRASMELFFARLLRAVERCTQLGVLPIMLTPFPRNPSDMTRTQLEPWHWLRRSLLDLRGNGLVVLDAASALGASADGGLTGAYRPEMSSDSIHPNDQGHSTVADLLSEAIRARLRTG